VALDNQQKVVHQQTVLFPHMLSYSLADADFFYSCQSPVIKYLFSGHPASAKKIVDFGAKIGQNL